MPVPWRRHEREISVIYWCLQVTNVQLGNTRQHVPRWAPHHHINQKATLLMPDDCFAVLLHNNWVWGTTTSPVVLATGSARVQCSVTAMASTHNVTNIASMRLQAARWWAALGAREPGRHLVPLQQLFSSSCSCSASDPGHSTRTPGVVFVVGAPGTGKSTQCERLVREFGFAHLSAGQLLRDAIADGHQEGEQLQAIIQAGQIVPAHVRCRSRPS